MKQYRVSYYFRGNVDGREDGHDNHARFDVANVNASFNVGKRNVMGRIIEYAVIKRMDGTTMAVWTHDNGRAVSIPRTGASAFLS